MAVPGGGLSCGCGAVVHRDCYLVASTDASFTCQPCAAAAAAAAANVISAHDSSPAPAPAPLCALCKRGGGVLVATTVDGDWVHGICALYTPGVSLAASAKPATYTTSSSSAAASNSTAVPEAGGGAPSTESTGRTTTTTTQRLVAHGVYHAWIEGGRCGRRGGEFLKKI